MKQLITLLAAGALSGTVAAALPQAPGGLCAERESVYFSCQTSLGRWIALCGTANDKIQYRFGTAGYIELAFPGPDGGRQVFRYAHYFRTGVDRMEVLFRNGGVDYAVFDYSERGRRTAGVRVASDSGREREFKCRGTIRNRLAELEGVLPCDQDSALNLGSCPAPSEQR
jgi:hypothetical protein